MIWRRLHRSYLSILLAILLIALSSSLIDGFITSKAEVLNRSISRIEENKRVLKDVHLTTPELIRKQGYPAEVHHVNTKDGYILEMHRIPHGITDVPSRGPIYVHHCLLCSSSDFIMNTPDKAIAYMLADAGFDVWLGNSRGNTYSRQHRLLSPDNPLFWQFSFSEMGRYDAPASIDYVLNATEHQQLYYLGYSMGTTVFFVMMDYHPEYNEKIIGMIALAPVAYVTHLKGPLGSMIPYTGTVNLLLNLAGMYEFLPSSKVMDMFASSLCSSTKITAPLCHNLLFALTGPDPEQLNQDYLPVILSHTPAGTSLKTMIHYMQSGQADRFQEYDYGFFGNYRRYGQSRPRAYNLTKVTAPVAVFYSDNDWLAAPEDVSRLLGDLPNIVLTHRVTNRNFSHVDFVWGLDAVSLVYLPLLDALDNF